jgi:hypothetical protein
LESKSEKIEIGQITFAHFILLQTAFDPLVQIKSSFFVIALLLNAEEMESIRISFVGLKMYS